MTLDTRRVKMKTGKYPVKLLVTFGRESRRYQTIYDLTKSEHENLSVSRVSEPMQKIRESLKLLKRTAEDTATALNPFSFEDSEKGFVFDNPLLHQRKYITKAAAAAYTGPDDFGEMFALQMLPSVIYISMSNGPNRAEWPKPPRAFTSGI